METAVSTDVVTTTLDYLPHSIDPKAVEQALLIGDLSQMSDEVRIAYYIATCRSVGLNPLTKPFQALKGDDGKISLYPDKGCAEQLRKLHRVSVKVVGRELLDDLYIVTVRASMPDGREEEAQGVVPIAKAKGTWEQSKEGRRYFRPAVDADGREVTLPLSVTERATAMMRCETKAKRRVTLAICGLGMPDWEQEPGSAAHPMALTLQPSPAPSAAKPLAETIADAYGEARDPTAFLSSSARGAREASSKNRQESAQEGRGATQAPRQGVKDLPEKGGLKNDPEGARMPSDAESWRETVAAHWEAFLTRAEGDDTLETIGLVANLQRALEDLTTPSEEGQRLRAEMQRYLDTHKDA
jgi:hypothetical protein